MNNLKEKKEIIKKQDREIYSKMEKIAATYKNKIIFNSEINDSRQFGYNKKIFEVWQSK